MTIYRMHTLEMLAVQLCIMVMMFVSVNAWARPNTASCDAAHTINSTLAAGGEWSMCWSADIESSVVLSNIVYSSPAGEVRRVLGDLSLSQIELQYDDGQSAEYLLTDHGFGGSNTVSFDQETCADGNILQNNSVGIICSEEISRGYIYKYYSSHTQGSLLQLRTLSRVNGLIFVQRWQFFDTGDIAIALGTSGVLQQYGSSANGWKVNDSDYATGFTLLPVWRLDFDIGADSGNDKVVEIESRPSSSRYRKIRVNTEITNEAARPIDSENKRFWQIADDSETIFQNQFVSYQLEPLDLSDHGQTNLSWLQNDFFVTRYKACEQHAMDNPRNNCGGALNEFINGQSVSSSDLVVWYKTMYHHLPRAEDNSAIPIRWTGYSISPRDWVIDNPFAP